MGSLGELLRSAREKKNISLDDIANATKISKNILIALEDEKYELLPSKVFVKGFLRSYGRYVGLEINELWNLYERACGEKKSDKPSEPPEAKKKRFRASYLIFLFLLLGLFGLLVYHFCCLKGNFESSLIPQHKKTTSQETKTTEKVQPPGDKILSNQEVISPAEESLSEKEPLNLRDILPPTDSYLSEQKGIISVSPSVPPPLPILMKATCYATTWIGYVIDNGQPSQMFLYPGDEFSCEGRERIELKIGNAGGIKITVNGIPLKIIGKSGEVVKVIFTKEFLIINNGEPQKLELWREGNQTQLEESE